MIKAEKAHITNLRADKARFEPNTWRNIPTPTTSICPEEFNRIEIAIEENYKIRPRYTNCKNCGAPLKSDECEYCGTQYGKE